MAEPTYQRLTRSIRSNLWLGSDHLLLVVQDGYVEHYKRFYFRDIQAFIVHQTSLRTVWNGILAAPLAICLIGLMLSLSSGGDVSRIVWAVFTAVFLLPLVVNNILGAGCACQLRTAVKVQHVSSLRRVRQTQMVFERIRPLIAAAQGRLNPEEVSARMQEAASGVAPASTPPILS